MKKILIAATLAVALPVVTFGLSRAAAQVPPAAGGGAAEAAPKKLPTVAEFVKEYQAAPVTGGEAGLFTFYRHDPNDATKDPTRILMAIPRPRQGTDLLMANSISRGPAYGNQLDDGVLVRFQRSGNRVLLIAPDTRLATESAKPIIGAVQETYRPMLISGFPILAEDPGSGTVVIDISPMVFSNTTGGAAPGAVRRDLSSITKIKVFPENTLIDVDLYSTMGDSGTSVGISYAFRTLPAIGQYTPRAADERIGYFTTVRQDWTAPYNDPENLTRYINRWNLKKQDASLEVSPPEKPIVFIVEKTVPVQFRKAVADGIAEWNKAFEKVGISGAIVVQQQTDDNEFKDIDPEDARYNFIRWIVTGRGYAMGPSRPDPRTGQLLDATIIFDDSMVRFYQRDFDIYGPKGLASDLGESITEYFKEYPEFLSGGSGPELLRESRTPDTKAPPVAEFKQQSPAWAHLHSQRNAMNAACNIGTGLRQQLSVLRLAAASVPGGKLPERFIYQVIKDITCHEVGHTLGLRHNFKGSSWLTVDEIKAARDTDGPLWASVMDYNAYAYFAGDKLEQVRNLVSPCIGPYDFWAIEYGYGSTAGKSEAEFLKETAKRNTEKGLAYATDEDVQGFNSPDPLANRFDMSADPVAWSQSRVQLSDSLLKDVAKWGQKETEPNYYLRSAFSTLMFERSRNMSYVARLVSGQYQSRSRPGDPNAAAAFVLVDSESQRTALKYLCGSIFAEKFFDIDPALLNKLAVSRWSDWASNPTARTDYPVHAAALSMQSGALTTLINATALQRIYDSELKTTDGKKFTVAELLTTLQGSLFSELDKVKGGSFTDASPGISSLRRNLQTQYITSLLGIADLTRSQAVSPDLQNTVRGTLRDLSGKLVALTKDANLDLATRAHLAEGAARIDRVLNAPHSAPGGGGGGFIMMMGRDGQPVTPAAEGSGSPSNGLDSGR